MWGRAVISCCCLTTLCLEAPQEALATLSRGFSAAGQARHPPWQAAVATWPDAVQAVALCHYGVGFMKHHLPSFGPLLFQCSGM